MGFLTCTTTMTCHACGDKQTLPYSPDTAERYFFFHGWQIQDEKAYCYKHKLPQKAGAEHVEPSPIYATGKPGWDSEGKRCRVLAPPIFVGGQFWTAVLWDEDEDPDFCKTAALSFLDP